MICEKCGEPIAQDALYCENCGARAALQADAAQSAAEAEKNTRVWVSKRLGSRYHSSPDCPLVIKPKEMTRQEAEDEGYTSCDWCW